MRQWERWIEDALGVFAEGDNAVWEAALVLTPQGPQIGFTVWMPGAVLGTVVQNTVTIPAPPAQTAETIREMVRAVVAMMHEERARALGLPPAPNGQGPGLILPG